MTAILIVIIGLLALGSLLVRRRAGRQRARRQYQETLKQALSDGILTAEEAEELEAIRARGDLSQAEVRMAALAIYRGALRDAVSDARLTGDEDTALRQLQKQLGLTEHDIGARDLTQVSRLRMLERISFGDLPVVPAPIALVPEETCHWVVQSTLAQRLSLRGGAPFELAGVALQVLGAEQFSAAGERAALRPSDDVLPTDLGVLVITSRRTIFQGAKRTLSIPHARLEELVLYLDGVRLDEIGGSATRFFLVEDAELTAGVLLQAARKRRIEIRPARPGRTA